MDTFGLRPPVDAAAFALGLNDPRTKYGLPQEIAFCKRCVISNQRPNSAVEFKHTSDSKKKTIHLDDEGICDACRVAEEKRGIIDWRKGSGP
jgi:hypothetical protein